MDCSVIGTLLLTVPAAMFYLAKLDTMFDLGHSVLKILLH